MEFNKNSGKLLLNNIKNNNNINSNINNNNIDNTYIINLLQYKSYSQGVFYFSFLGLNTLAIASGLLLVNLNDFIEDEFLEKIITNDTLMLYKKFDNIIHSIVHEYFTNTIKNIKFMLARFFGFNVIFYVDFTNIINNLINEKKYKLTDVEIIKHRLDNFSTNLNKLCQLGSMFNIVILTEYNNFNIKNDGIYKFINDYIKSNKFLIHSYYNNYIYLLGKENEKLDNIFIILKHNIKFIDIDIFTLLRNNLNSFPNTMILDLDVINDYLVNNYNLNYSYITSKDAVNKHNKLYPKLIYKVYNNINNLQVNIVKELTDEIKNNIKYTLTTIMNYEKTNNWIITLNNHPIFDNYINNSFEEILKTLYTLTEKKDTNNNINIYSNNNIKSNNKETDNKDTEDNMSLIGISYEIVPCITSNIFNMINNINNINNIQQLKEINNSDKYNIILHKIYIYKKLSPFQISNIIKKHLLSKCIINNSRNKNIVVVYNLYSDNNTSKKVKHILNSNSNYNFGNIFIDCKFNYYLRKLLAFLSYQNEFVKTSTAIHKPNLLFQSKYTLYNRYNNYLSYIFNNNISKDTPSNTNINLFTFNNNNHIDTNIDNNINISNYNNIKKSEHCTCCNCESKNNNYYLQYKHIPYLDNDIKDKLIGKTSYYWIF